MPSPSPPAPAASQPNPASTPAGVTALLERSVLAFVTAAASSDPMTAAQLRAAYVASVSHALLHTGATMTKRDLYYLCRALFRTSVSADRAVTALARSLGVPSNDLNIVAAPKGIASGPVSWIDESNAHVSVGGFGPAGALIPARPERLRRLRTSASLILVLEKESAFEALVHDPRFQHLCASWLVVTGKGYPDHATRGLLRGLLDARGRREPPLAVHIVTDADPHGASIAVCYARALSSLDVHWSGVHPSHRDVFFRIPAAAELALTDRERSMAAQLLAECKANSALFPALSSNIARGLEDMLQSGVKFEIEAVAAVGATAEGNPLLEYLLAVLPAQAF